MSDDEIIDLLDDLDIIAREHDHYEYGLPLYGTTLQELIKAVRNKLEQHEQS